LSEEEKSKGVIAASAGNHAQGVALGALKKNIKATIVMPSTTPLIKVNSVREYGAKVVLHGDNFDEACAHAEKLREKHGHVFVHPYDDPDVIAGQGTIGMEIIRECRQAKAIFVPVGGGGLIAGIAAYVKYLRPDIKVIGVESDESACLEAALRDGKRTVLSTVGIFADGVAVKQIGKEPYKIAKHCVDEVVTVNTDEICAAIKDIYLDLRSIAEPAGALSVAGIKKYLENNDMKGESLVAIVSGANVNFDRLRHISERTEVGEKREAILAVEIPERPGSFKNFCETLSTHNITEFNYRFSDPDKAIVFSGVQLDHGSQRQEVIDSLKNKGYPVIDLSDNELAKLHIRHMVGGRASHVEHERVYRFQFPERKGALLKFFNTMGQQWNISMFHYRNHGAEYGRVFIGLQVPPGEYGKFDKFLRELNYSCIEESDNPAYSAFLR
jgi:threonine dehydratase